MAALVTVYRRRYLPRIEYFFPLWDGDNARVGVLRSVRRFLFPMHRLQRGRGTPDEAPRRAAARRLHSLRSCCVWDLLISGRGLERHETGTVERPVAMPSHGRRRRQQGGRDPLMSRSGSGGGGPETLEGLKFQFHERRL